MQYMRSRQDVTGLVVNEKVNVRREYLKLARAQCKELITNGKAYETFKSDGEISNKSISVDKLRGILSHIFWVKGHEQSHSRIGYDEKFFPTHYKTYRRFLDYISFGGNINPTIICEGKTDNIYLKCAMKSLAVSFPKLIELARVEN